MDTYRELVENHPNRHASFHLLGAQCNLCGCVNKRDTPLGTAACVLPLPIYCRILARDMIMFSCLSIALCSSCYRKINAWIIFTLHSYPILERASVNDMIEQLTVEYHQNSYLQQTNLLRKPGCVRITTQQRKYPRGHCGHCGAPPKPPDFAFETTRALLRGMLSRPDPDLHYAALPAGLRAQIADAAYAPVPHMVRLLPDVKCRDPIDIEIIKMTICNECHRRGAIYDV